MVGYTGWELLELETFPTDSLELDILLLDELLVDKEESEERELTELLELVEGLSILLELDDSLELLEWVGIRAEKTVNF